MSINSDSQSSQWNKLFERERIINSLETIQNAIVIALAIALFCVMLIRQGRFVPLSADPA